MAKRQKKPKREVRPRGRTDPIPDEVQATVWVLIEEGKSWRQVANATGIHVATVGRILARDPMRLEALTSALRQERAKLWHTLENKTLITSVKLAEAMDGAVFTQGGALKKSKSEAERELLEFGPKMLTSFRHSADSATKMNQLLTGGATERIEQMGAEMLAEEMTPDQVIDACLDAGLMLMLPAALRELVERRQASKQLPGAEREIIDEA